MGRRRKRDDEKRGDVGKSERIAKVRHGKE